jgi:hypothetical protein
MLVLPSATSFLLLPLADNLGVGISLGEELGLVASGRGGGKSGVEADAWPVYTNLH